MAPSSKSTRKAAPRGLRTPSSAPRDWSTPITSDAAVREFCLKFRPHHGDRIANALLLWRARTRLHVFELIGMSEEEVRDEINLPKELVAMVAKDLAHLMERVPEAKWPAPPPWNKHDWSPQEDLVDNVFHMFSCQGDGDRPLHVAGLDADDFSNALLLWLGSERRSDSIIALCKRQTWEVAEELCINEEAAAWFKKVMRDGAPECFVGVKGLT